MPKRADNNQPSLVAFARKLGATCHDTHTLGKGFPDYILGFGQRSILWEIKAENGRLTEDEEKWQREWKGEPVWVVRNEDDVLASLGLHVCER